MTSMACEQTFDLRDKRVWIAGHTGLVGSALHRRLSQEPCDLLLAGHDELDLIRQDATEAWMRRERPQVVVVAAARVGGIMANSRYPADFLYDNLMIAANVLRTAHEIGVERLVWLGSSCIYPREAEQPIQEDSLLTGPLEATNEAYAIAKIAGLKLAESYNRQHGQQFFTVMPCNLYGPNDNFDPQNSHVIPALMRRMHEAKEAGAQIVELWGTGTPLREFLHVDDLADAVVLLLRRHVSCQPVNVGSSLEISIADLAHVVARVVGYRGRIVFDSTKPDGTPRKVLGSQRVKSLGWRPSISLEDGLGEMYRAWRARNAVAQPPLGRAVEQVVG